MTSGMFSLEKCANISYFFWAAGFGEITHRWRGGGEGYHDVALWNLRNGHITLSQPKKSHFAVSILGV